MLRKEDWREETARSIVCLRPGRQGWGGRIRYPTCLSNHVSNLILVVHRQVSPFLPLSLLHVQPHQTPLIPKSISGNPKSLKEELTLSKATGPNSACE